MNKSLKGTSQVVGAFVLSTAFLLSPAQAQNAHAEEASVGKANADEATYQSVESSKEASDATNAVEEAPSAIYSTDGSASAAALVSSTSTTPDAQTNSQQEGGSGIYTVGNLSVSKNSDGTWSISQKISGDAPNLTYKFVWSTPDWKQWGIVKQTGTEASTTWIPEHEGEVIIYCDITDPQGHTRTTSTTIEAARAWDFKPSISASSIAIGSEVTIQSNSIGASAAKLQYNYVWQRNNSWKDGDWGSFVEDTGEMTSNSSWTFKPAQSGSYTIYVTTRYGQITCEKKLSFTVSEKYSLGTPQVASAASPTVGSELSISMPTSGQNSGLTYKFVWSTPGWKKWGVIQAQSKQNEVRWIPTAGGKVTLYVDITDSTGKTTTKTVDINVKTNVASYSGVKLSGTSNLKVGDTLHIEPQFSASTTTGLKFKYVWERDNWKSWGIIQEATNASSLDWKLPVSGNVAVYVDIIDIDGTTTTRAASFTAKGEQWSYDSVSASKQLVQPGESVNLAAQASGETSYLSYKWVWSRNNWSSWGVIKQGTDLSSISWTPTSAGNYQVFCDITGSDGRTVTKTVDVQAWRFIGINTTAFDLNESWDVSADLGISNTTGFTFKFVWATPDWSKWGILQNTSNINFAYFNPSKLNLGTGSFDIYVDVTDPNGITSTKSVRLTTTTQRQRNMVNAAHRTPSPGAGLCAAWITNLAVNAGEGYVGGDACDMYWAYCHSSNLSDLKIGMIVATPSHPHTNAGRLWGHIALYVGNNQVMDNYYGYIRTSSLTDWINYYGTTHTVKWGWLGNRPLD